MINDLDFVGVFASYGCMIGGTAGGIVVYNNDDLEIKSIAVLVGCIAGNAIELGTKSIIGKVWY